MDVKATPSLDRIRADVKVLDELAKTNMAMRFVLVMNAAFFVIFGVVFFMSGSFVVGGLSMLCAVINAKYLVAV